MTIISAFGLMSKSSRRYKKAAYKLEQARGRAALENVRGEIAFRETEDPREQAGLKQSAFARGLGKSTIEQQDRARLTDIQARRMAALRRAEDIGVQGLALIKKRRRMERKQMYWDVADAALAAIISMGQATKAGYSGAGGQQAQGTAMGWQGAAGGMAGSYGTQSAQAASW